MGTTRTHFGSRLDRVVMVVATALALGGCATLEGRDADAATTRAMLDAVGARHDRALRNARSDASWQVAKAGCWLDVAWQDYVREERSTFAPEAARAAAAILDALESDADVDDHTPLAGNAWRLRSDLWTRATALMRSPAHACLASRTACAQVRLVQAGQAHSLGGWAYSKPHLALVASELDAIERSAATCDVARAPLAPAVPVVTRAAVPDATASTPEPEPSKPDARLVLAADVLFDFGQSSLAAMTPAGRARLDAFVRELATSFATLDDIDIAGHADRIGEPAWNFALSAARAATVRDYLVARGLPIGIMRARGLGQSHPIARCDARMTWTALKECLSPDRRVEIEVAVRRR